MSDTSPRDQAALLWNHRRAAAQPPPRARELVFEFVRGDHVRFRCDIVDDGPFGLDVQILRNEEFFYSRRFPNRALVDSFVAQERRALEQYDPNDPL
jgi:hypothetical protein